MAVQLFHLYHLHLLVVLHPTQLTLDAVDPPHTLVHRLGLHLQLLDPLQGLEVHRELGTVRMGNSYFLNVLNLHRILTPSHLLILVQIKHSLFQFQEDPFIGAVVEPVPINIPLRDHLDFILNRGLHFLRRELDAIPVVLLNVILGKALPLNKIVKHVYRQIIPILFGWRVNLISFHDGAQAAIILPQGGDSE